MISSSLLLASFVATEGRVHASLQEPSASLDNSRVPPCKSGERDQRFLEPVTKPFPHSRNLVSSKIALWRRPVHDLRVDPYSHINPRRAAIARKTGAIPRRLASLQEPGPGSAQLAKQPRPKLRIAFCGVEVAAVNLQVGYCSFAASDLACLSTEVSLSPFFHKERKSSYCRRAPAMQPSEVPHRQTI
jgi:hypothetical protein